MFRLALVVGVGVGELEVGSCRRGPVIGRRWSTAQDAAEAAPKPQSDVLRIRPAPIRSVLRRRRNAPTQCFCAARCSPSKRTCRRPGMRELQLDAGPPASRGEPAARQGRRAPLYRLEIARRDDHDRQSEDAVLAVEPAVGVPPQSRRAAIHREQRFRRPGRSIGTAGGRLARRPDDPLVRRPGVLVRRPVRATDQHPRHHGSRTTGWSEGRLVVGRVEFHPFGESAAAARVISSAARRAW